MSDTHGPIWIVEEPAKPYPDGRFDDPAIPDASTPVWASDMGMTPPPTFRAVVDVEPNITVWTDNNERLFHLLRRDDGSICLYYTRPNNPAQVVVWDSLDAKLNLQPPASRPPLDPQQPTPEQIADAARLAAPDIETVFRLYGHIQTHPLPELRALLDLLKPPYVKPPLNST